MPLMKKGSTPIAGRFLARCSNASSAGRSSAIALAVFAALLAPACSHAQVIISEIMYNPAGSDSGREWVELYNQGTSDVSIIGGTVKGSWRISDGSNHTLVDPATGVGRGSLTVPAGGYLIVASDPAEFISGEYAGGSYSVVKSSISLNNTGATLSLVGGDGTIVDSVSYAGGQGASDDGASLQKQADGSWLAALPTPGEANAIVPYMPPASGDAPRASGSPTSQSSSTPSGASTPTSSYVPPPSPSLFADAGSDRAVIVGADAEFDGRAYDKNRQPLDDTTTRFMWNFGDGSTAEGPAVRHHFEYPGTYEVVFSIANAKFSVSDHILVTAEPAALSFTVLPGGGVAIQNNAGHGLDLSVWIVRAGASAPSAQFILPENSVVPAGGTMHISKATLTFAATADTSLEYPNGVVALGAGQATGVEAQQAPAAAPVPPKAAPKKTPPVARPKAAEAPENVVESTASGPDAAAGATLAAPEQPAQEIAPASQSAAAGELTVSPLWWWGGAFLFALLGAGALFFARGSAKHEWDIEEMKS